MHVKHVIVKTGEALEDKVNHVLNELQSDSCKVVDIKYASSDMDLSALIIYQRQY